MTILERTFLLLLDSHGRLSQAEYNRDSSVNDETDFMAMEKRAIKMIEKRMGSDVVFLIKKARMIAEIEEGR